MILDTYLHLPKTQKFTCQTEVKGERKEYIDVGGDFSPFSVTEN